jgi:hypothetical protein
VSHISGEVCLAKQHSLVEVHDELKNKEYQAKEEDQRQRRGECQAYCEDRSYKGHLVVKTVIPFLKGDLATVSMGSLLMLQE